MFKGKLENGFEFQIEESKLDDWELVEMFSDIENGNLFKIVDVFKKILGDEQYKNLKNHIKEKEGNISIDYMQKVIVEIMQSKQETKN